MKPTTYTIQAYVIGLAWVTFNMTTDQDSVETLEHAAVHAGSSFPGCAPRRVRTLIDGKPYPKVRPSQLFSEPAYD